MSSRPRARSTRGVYELPFATTSEETILVAINAGGQRIAERCVRTDADVDAEWDSLVRLLDRNDPAPRLSLVRAS